MKLTKAQLKEIWQGQTARATPRRAECLSEEQFVRAVTGEMGQQESAQMAMRLFACSDCVEEYRILRSLRPLAEQAEAIMAASTAPIVSRRLEKRGQCDAAVPGRLGPHAASRMQDRI